MINERTPVVLVADDDPSMLTLVAQHARTLGYRVLEASDGDEALELAREHLPDLIVLDVMMPGPNGWEVCRRVREDVALAHTGVVMLTGMGESLNAMTSPLLGADEYIDKPFEFPELDAKIRSTLAKRALLRQSIPGLARTEPSEAADDPADDANGGNEPRPARRRRTAKKVAPKRGPAKRSAKRAAAEKAPAKRGAKKAAKKPATKKAPAKPAAKKAAAKKAATKPAAKKIAAKKAATKKAVSKPARRAAGAQKKAAKPARKAIGTKKLAAKPARKAASAKKPSTRKAVSARKPAAKPGRAAVTKKQAAKPGRKPTTAKKAGRKPRR